ncbi:MAG: SCO1664 family protein, partial [Anaerolineales bacterium]
ILSLLCAGEIEMVGQVTWSSNYTFLTQLKGPQGEIPAIYKPARGERPLWDFPVGTLAARETAAFHTSHVLGWNFVPPTVLREDGPAGPGSMQLYIDVDQERHYFSLDEKQKEKLKPVVVFDILINNADRKGGHVLIDEDNKIWLIDHGVCFHTEHKLRTVIWDFIGTPIPDNLLDDVQVFIDLLASRSEETAPILALLSDEEIQAMISRGEKLVHKRVFPEPGQSRPYPWPLV